MLLSMYVPPSRASSPFLGFACGSFAAAAGGGDGAFDTFFAGVFASTFADAAWNGGYPDEDAAFAGGGDGGFAGGGDGAFVGGLGVVLPSTPPAASLPLLVVR